jgi:hypothetical protein
MDEKTKNIKEILEDLGKIANNFLNLYAKIRELDATIYEQEDLITAGDKAEEGLLVLEYILTRMLREKTDDKKGIGEYNKEGIEEYNEGDLKYEKDR